MLHGNKKCNGCLENHPLTNFHKQKGRPDGRRTLCKECLAEKSRAYLLKKRFGISVEEYESILESQGGVCAICRSDTPGGRWENFHVDHCHDTGEIRGILCHGCNISLGQFGDTYEGISRVLDYLHKPELARRKLFGEFAGKG